MAHKVQIPRAVLRELDVERDNPVSAAPKDRAETGRQAGRQEQLFTVHPLCA